MRLNYSVVTSASIFTTKIREKEPSSFFSDPLLPVSVHSSPVTFTVFSAQRKKPILHYLKQVSDTFYCNSSARSLGLFEVTEVSTVLS